MIPMSGGLPLTHVQAVSYRGKKQQQQKTQIELTEKKIQKHTTKDSESRALIPSARMQLARDIK